MTETAMDQQPELPFLIFTPAAVDRIAELIEAEDDTTLHLRLTVEADGDERGYHFSLDSETRPDDAVFDYGRICVLVDQDSRKQVEGCEIDYVADAQGERFVVRQS